MKKLIHDDDSDLGRLHCDNGACGHILPEALPWSKALIGYPCPKCGSNMLSAGDFKTVDRFRRIVGFINRWFGRFGTETPQPHHQSKSFRIVSGKLTSKS